MRWWSWAPVAGLLAVACGDSTSHHRTEGSTGADGIFFNLGFESIGATEAVLSFDTTLETTCEAELSEDGEAFDERFTDPSMDPDDPYDFAHRVPLTGLRAETTYWVRALAEDPDGEQYLSAPLRFTTAAEAPGDGGSGIEQMRNVALVSEGAVVTDVSSIFGGSDFDGTWGIHKAMDGSEESAWSTRGDGDDAYAVLDLGTRHPIRRFGFRSREMADGSSIVRSIQLTLDDETVVGPLPTPDPGTLYRFDFDPPLETRVVRLDAVETTGGNTGAREIQLWSPVSR